MPKKYRFFGDKVVIKWMGHGVVLLPYEDDNWDTLFNSLEQFSNYFINDALQQPPEQDRDNGFE